MEAPQQQHQHQQQQPNDQDGGSGKSSSFLCRQSSTRWTPTTDQIRILKDLYYNNGIRSPTAEQIQKISARLRQYGKIEGKNVFYWFQNHKARERQKKRFTAEIPMQRGVWRSSEDPIYNNNNKYPNINHGITSPSTSSPGVLAVGHMGNYSYGSVAMEKSFRDCSISTCGNGDGSMGQNFAWVGVDPSYPSTYPFLDKRKAVDETLDHEDQDQDQEHAAEIETLPLFPMHGEDISGFCNIKRESSESYYTHDWFRSENNMGGAAARASLELSLNSYCGRSTEAP